MKSGFILYADQYAPIQGLTDEQKGKLLDAFFKFNMGQEVTFSDPVLSMAFAFFRQTFERDTDAYERKCQKNRDNVSRRYTTSTDSTTVDDGSERTQSNTTATNIIQPDNNPTQRDKDTPLPPTGGRGCGSSDAPLPEQEEKQTGRVPEAVQEAKPKRQRFDKPTPAQIAKYCLERDNGISGQEFWDFYESKGWTVGNSPMKDWKAAVRTWENKRKNGNPRASPAPMKSWAEQRADQIEADFLAGRI